MKRIISLVLILALLPACLAVPAMADETINTGFYDILKYSTPNDIGSYLYRFNLGSKINFTIPISEGTLYGLDIIVRTNSTTLDISYNYYSTVYSLNRVSLGDGIYRYYSSDLSGGPVSPLTLNISYTDGSYVQFYKLDAIVTPTSRFPVNVIFSGYNGSEGLFIDKHFTNSGPITQSFPIDSANDAYNGGYFEAIFKFNEQWQAYDFIDVVVDYDFGEIGSVFAEINGTVIPVEVSDLWINSTQPSLNPVSVRLDLRGIDRTSSSYPVLTISGTAIEGTNRFTIYSAYGYISLEEPSSWIYWFSNLQNWLSSGFSSVTSGLSALGTNISSWIASQTSSITSAFVSHQQALIAAEKTQHEADRQLWNTISSNISTWITTQTNAITSSLSTINTAVTNFRTNVGDWITTQTNALTSSISSWGQSIIDSITSGVDRIVEVLTPDDDASEFQDKLDNSLGQLGQAGAAMDSVARPNIGDVDLNVSARVPVSGLNAVASLVNLVYENEVLGSVMWMFFTLSLAAFVIFGRS